MPEKSEHEKQPDIRRQEALEVIDSLDFETDDWQEFEYLGNFFNLIPTSEDDHASGEEDIKYSASTQMGGWDIYLRKSLPADVKKRKLFHEIIEVSLKVQGFEEEDEAHDMAKKEEEDVFGEREDE